MKLNLSAASFVAGVSLLERHLLGLDWGLKIPAHGRWWWYKFSDRAGKGADRKSDI